MMTGLQHHRAADAGLQVRGSSTCPTSRLSSGWEKLIVSESSAVRPAPRYVSNPAPLLHGLDHEFLAAAQLDLAAFRERDPW